MKLTGPQRALLERIVERVPKSPDGVRTKGAALRTAYALETKGLVRLVARGFLGSGGYWKPTDRGLQEVPCCGEFGTGSGEHGDDCPFGGAR